MLIRSFPRRPVVRWAVVAALPLAGLTALLHGTAPATAAEEAPDVTRLVAAARKLDLAMGRRVEGLAVRIGSLTLSLREGLLFPVTGEDGAEVGRLFVGQGSYAYRSQDPVDRKVIGLNLAKVGSAKLDADFNVADGLTAALVMTTPPWSGVFAAAPSGGDATPDTAAREVLGRLHDRMLDRAIHRLACARRNGLAGHSYAYAEIDAAGRNVLFEHDQQETFTESLMAVDRREGQWLREEISYQRLDDLAKPASGALVLRETRFDVTTEDNRSGTISSDLTLEVAREGIRAAAFALVSHRDPRGYWPDPGDNRLEVVEVKDGSGAPLSFIHDRHELLVDFGSPRARGERLRLHVRTRGEVFTGMQRTRADNYFVFGGDAWYPQPLGFEPAGFSYSIRVASHKPFVPIASGQRVSLKEEGNSWVLETRRESPSKHPVVLGGKFHMHEETVNGLVIRVHSYATERKDLPPQLVRLASAFVSYYQETLGPYPFEELDIVEIPDFGYGIAPSGVVLLTTEAYKPFSSALARYFSQGINSRLAHEIAHHYFGHTTMVSHPRDTWLNESFAEYASGLAMGAVEFKGGHRVLGFKDMVVGWRNAAEEVENVGSVLSANQLSGNEWYEHRFSLLYNRGPMLLHMLRSLVGDQQFEAMLRKFLERGRQGVVTTQDFRAAVKDVRGIDMSWFFDDWVATATIPKVTYQFRTRQAEGGRYVVEGTLEQDPARFAKIVVPFVVQIRGAGTVVKVVMQDKPSTPFLFELPGEPQSIEVDPNKNNLARYQRRS